MLRALDDNRRKRFHLTLKRDIYRRQLIIYLVEEHEHGLGGHEYRVVVGHVVVAGGGVEHQQVRRGQLRHGDGVGQLEGAHPAELETRVECLLLLSVNR